jgi:hypothetical protein
MYLDDLIWGLQIHSFIKDRATFMADYFLRQITISFRTIFMKEIFLLIKVREKE